MKKFEYLTYSKQLSDKDLNRLGAEGWELISHSAIADGGAMAQYYVFKREINGL